MRVIMMTPLYLPWVGGLEILVQQLNRELVGRGHEVVVITSHGNESNEGWGEVDGVPVLRLPAHRSLAQRDTAAMFRIQTTLARVSRDFDPHVIHSHDAGPLLWLYLRSARRAARPLVVSLHNVMTHQFDGAPEVLGSLLERADWVTGVSQDVVDDALAFAPGIAHKMSVIRNGIVPPVRTVSPVPVDPPALACIGRLVDQKGFHLAIDAVAALAPRHPALRLTIAGDGPQRRPLADRVTQHGIDDRVEFLGIVGREEIAALLEASTAVVMPSRFEGLPLVALEAAWAGRPVVATRAPGLDEAVLDDETALVVDFEGRELAAAIERILSDPALAQRLGHGARAFAERACSITACVDAYEALYGRVAAGPTGALD